MELLQTPPSKRTNNVVIRNDGKHTTVKETPIPTHCILAPQAYSQAEVASALGSLDAPTRTAATESLQRHMTVGAAPLKVAGLREEPTARPLTARGAASGVAPKRAAHSRSAGSHVSSATSGSAIEVGDACLLVVNDRKEDRARRVR